MRSVDCYTFLTVSVITTGFQARTVIFVFILLTKFRCKFLFMEVYIMRVIISIILMVIAALVGFFFGAGMNEAMGGAILLSMITGFACTINAIEKNKKD